MTFILSEAYSNLYNPRVDSNLDDNLRFIDYMQSEDIEEVVESIYWELRDYGHTIDEAFELLDFSTSTEIMLESSDQIIAEARKYGTKVTYGGRRDDGYSELSPDDIKGGVFTGEIETRSKNTSRRGADARAARAAARAARVNTAKEVVKRFVSGAQRGVSGAMSGAQRGVSGAMSGAQRGVSGAMGGVQRTASAVSGAAQEGKARLMQLLRGGMRSAGEQVGRFGRVVSGSGRRAAMPRTYSVNAPGFSAEFNVPPSMKRGRMRRAVGGAISRAAARLYTAGQ